MQVATSHPTGQNFKVLRQKKKDADIFFRLFNIILCYFIREKICPHLSFSNAKLYSFDPAGGWKYLLAGPFSGEPAVAAISELVMLSKL